MGVAIIVEIASTYKEENNIAEYNSWMKKAILEATGQKEIQKKLGISSGEYELLMNMENIKELTIDA